MAWNSPLVAARSIARAPLRVWRHPLSLRAAADIDAPETFLVHREIILSKPQLQEIYRGWYRELLPAVEATAHLNLPMIELGCGASHFERYIPDVIKTDVVAQPNATQVVNAEALPFLDSSLRAIFMVGVFHHIPEPRRFLAEADERRPASGHDPTLPSPQIL